MRILITGSRDWTDDQSVIEAICWYSHEEDLVFIHGDCSTGADRIARDICKQERIEQEKYPADWKKHGRSAGPKRNKQMIDTKPDLCIAFIKNNSKGASGTLELAEKAGIKTEVYRE